MDYFGLMTDDTYDDVKIYDCYGKEMIGSRCETTDCNNRAAKCGDVPLAHCNENIKCLSRNLQDLVIENKRIREKLENYKNFYKL